MPTQRIAYVDQPYAGRRHTPDTSRLSALYQRGGEQLADISLRKGATTAALFDRLGALFSGYQELERQKKATIAATALRQSERAEDRGEKEKDRAERAAERKEAERIRLETQDRAAASRLVDDVAPGPVDDTPESRVMLQLAQRFPETAARFRRTTTLPATPLGMGEMAPPQDMTVRVPTGQEARQAASDTAARENIAAARAREVTTDADRVTDNARMAAAAVETARHNRVMETNAARAPQGPQPTWQWVTRDGKEVYTNRVLDGDRPQTNRVKATEDERKTAGFYGQMSDAITTIDELEKDITETELYQIQTLPHEALIGLMNRNKLSESAKRYLRAFEQFTESRLRPVSGAAIADTEYARDRRTYAKQYGETPKIAEDRKRARNGALDALKKRAGVALDDANADGKPAAQPGSDRVYYDADGNQIKKP